jgi:hypothetical protein
MGFRQIRLRPSRWMIGMRMIEAHDVASAFSALTLHLHQFLRINVITVLWGVIACISAPNRRLHDIASIFHFAEEHPTALKWIGLLSVLADFVEVGLRNQQHCSRSI